MAVAFAFPETQVATLEKLLVAVCTRLQPTDAQHELARQHYEALGAWLDDSASELRPYKPKIYPQGSVKIGTLVKPHGRDEYDVDLVCEMAIDASRVANPVILLDMVQSRIEKNGIYKFKIRRKKRCIRLVYEHNFHLDVLPACPDLSAGGTCLWVPDRELKGFKASNPLGYASWFDQQTSKVLRTMMTDKAEQFPQKEAVNTKGTLKLVVQLLKRWRDIAFATSDLGPLSIVLTTLAATHYDGELSVPLALSKIVEAIVDSIPVNTRLIVLNPMNPKEDFSEKWEDRARYLAFVNGMGRLRQDLRELLEAQGLQNIAAKLKVLFGEDLSKRVVEEFSEKYKKASDAGQSRFQPHTGRLTTVAAVASVPVVRHTFHGE